jgi:hypothetical protein
MRIDALQTVLALTLADADGDGDVDIYVGTADRTRLYVNRLVEEGGAQVDLSFALGPEAPTASAVREITVADVDFEEPPDVVMATDAGIQIRLQGLEGAAAQTLGSGPETRSNLVLADLDLDGRLDLVYGNRRGGQVTVHFGVADASTPFSQAEHIDLDTDATQVAVDDFVGDSLPEIVVLTVDGASNPSALRLVTQENGAFVVNSSFGPAAPAGGAGATVALDSGRFAVGDLNGDGRLDLILAAEVLGQALVFENNGSLTPFQGAPRELMTLPSPQQMALADLTGSGALDVLAASGNELHAILPTEVEPPPPPAGTFQLSIDPVEARQGDLDAAALVRLTNSDPLGGYTVVLVHDPDTITPTAAGIEGTITGAAAVEFMNFSADTDRHTSSFSVLVDILPPIENRQLPVGQNQLLFRLLFDVPQDAPLGPSTLSFDDGTINPAVRTVVVVGANSVQPQTSPGTVSILPAQTEPPPGNPNVMRVTNAAIGVGQEGAVSILGTVEQEADAFTIIGAVDPDNLEILELDLTGSVTETLGPEFVQPSIRPDEGNFVFTTILDFLPPFLRQTLPPGQDQLLLTVRLRAHDDADPGTYPLPLVNGVGEPPLNNIFVFDGQSVFPALLPGEVRVGSEPPPTAATFIRGDANADDRINLADANFISNFLSLSGPTPPCLDAADANDDGEVTTDDATYILNFAAVGGAPPPPPFPEAGPDPTADGLSCGDSP